MISLGEFLNDRESIAIGALRHKTVVGCAKQFDVKNQNLNDSRREANRHNLSKTEYIGFQ